MNKKHIPNILKRLAKRFAYALYLTSEKILQPPFDKYDFETFEVIKKVIKNGDNCVDVGAHEGEILSRIINTSPKGKHYAFEPIPYLFKRLHKQFGKKAIIYNYALADTTQTAEFTYIKDRPAISGLKERTFSNKTYKKEIINVDVRRLDDIVESNLQVSLIKIDVEGAELLVLKRASSIISRDKPYVLFEFGLGGSNLYNTTPEQVFDFFTMNNMNVSTLKYFLNNKPPFDKTTFCNQYYNGYNYFFIAYNANNIKIIQ